MYEYYRGTSKQVWGDQYINLRKMIVGANSIETVIVKGFKDTKLIVAG